MLEEGQALPGSVDLDRCLRACNELRVLARLAVADDRRAVVTAFVAMLRQVFARWPSSCTDMTIQTYECCEGWVAGTTTREAMVASFDVEDPPSGTSSDEDACSCVCNLTPEIGASAPRPETITKLAFGALDSMAHHIGYANWDRRFPKYDLVAAREEVVAIAHDELRQLLENYARGRDLPRP